MRDSNNCRDTIHRIGDEMCRLRKLERGFPLWANMIPLISIILFRVAAFNMFVKFNDLALANPSLPAQKIAESLIEEDLCFINAKKTVMSELGALRNKLSDILKGEGETEHDHIHSELNKLIDNSFALLTSLNSIVPVVLFVFQDGWHPLRAGWKKECGFFGTWKMQCPNGTFKGVRTAVLYDDVLPGSSQFYTIISELIRSGSGEEGLLDIAFAEVTALGNAFQLSANVAQYDDEVLGRYGYTERDGDNESKIWRSVFVQSSVARVWETIARSDSAAWKDMYAEVIRNGADQVGDKTCPEGGFIRTYILNFISPLHLICLFSELGGKRLSELGAAHLRNYL